MLDTNMASFVLKGHPPKAIQTLVKHPVGSVVVSSVTKGELLYGVVRKGSPERLVALVKEFLLGVRVMPWDEDTATVYAELRASCSQQGVALSALDMMIAAHAVATHSVLVTHDKAFSLIPGNKLLIENWVQENE
jgi:tRNA(fMet)-specific endonuclease VapC